MQNEKIKLVIVDDHSLVRETWKMLLESSGSIQVVKECGSGREAIECAEQLSPDVILMDINMSPINGFEATRRILQTDPSQRIIGISINNQPGYARNMLEAGARGYMTKNSSKTEMLLAIREVLNGHTYICLEVRDKMQEAR